MAAPAYFHCFGVPRSGTTFFAALMNAHPRVLCGAERFLSHHFAPALLNRDGFLNAHAERLTPEFRATVLARDFAGLAAIGDKQPRAYFDLIDMARRFEALTLFVLLRKVDDIADSWNRRAEVVAATGTESLDGWHRGQRALFAYLELTVLVKTLLHHAIAHPVIFIPYDAMLDPARQEEVAAGIFARLGCDLTPEVRQFLAAEQPASSRSRARPKRLTTPEFALKNLPFFAVHNAFVSRFELGDMAAFRAAYAPAMNELERRDIARLTALIGDSGVLRAPEIAAYAREMNGTYRTAARRTPLPVIDAWLRLCGGA